MPSSSALRPLCRRNGLQARSVVSDMTKNLRVKVVAFDLPVVMVSDPKKASAGVSNDKSVDLATVGLDSDPNAQRRANSPDSTSVGDKATAGKLITSQAQDKTASKLESFVSPTSSKVDYKAKYAEKLQMRVAKAAAKSSFQGNIVNNATRWLLKEGMGDVLDYTYNRTVRLALVGGYESSQQTIKQLASQLSTLKFSYIRDPVTDFDQVQRDPSYRKEIYEQSLRRLEEQMSAKRGEILVVSGDEVMLQLSKDRGYHTCRYTGEQKRYGQVTTDFRANVSMEIKDAIDELIGIALRTSVSNNVSFR